MGAIEAAHLLDGLSDPRTLPDSQSHVGLDKRLTQQLKTHGIEYPPVKQEKATPPGHCPLHLGHGILLPWPQNPACFRLGPIGVLLLSLVL